MDSQEKATQLHDAGWNCCQAVLGSCCKRFEMRPEQAFHLGAFFGAGMRCGSVCGAVTGALMALGLAYGDENNRSSRKSMHFSRHLRRSSVMWTARIWWRLPE